MEILLSSEMKNRKDIIEVVLNILKCEFKKSITDLNESPNLDCLDRACFINCIEDRLEMVIPISDDDIFSKSINSIADYLEQLSGKFPND